MNNAGQPIQAAGIPWFTAETYDKCRSMFADADKLSNRFTDWLVSAEETEKQLTLRGVKVVRVIVDPEELAAWCIASGYSEINAHARGTFAAAKAADWVRANR